VAPGSSVSGVGLASGGSLFAGVCVCVCVCACVWWHFILEAASQYCVAPRRGGRIDCVPVTTLELAWSGPIVWDLLPLGLEPGLWCPCSLLTQCHLTLVSCLTTLLGFGFQQ
jgi:hypothetical protein